jgi:hypothetical protein
VHILLVVDVEWDGRKAQANLRKHGISFEDAVMVIYDEHAVTTEDDRFTEPRVATIGRDATGRVLLVVSTWRSSRLRLISARRATARERRLYSEGQ